MIYRLILILLSMYLWIACTDLLEPESGCETGADELVLSLSVDKQSVVIGANDASLNEALVERVDVFFVEKESRTIIYKYADSGRNGKFMLVSSGWKAEFTASEYEVHVLANMHSFDNPATPSDTETDLSWVKTEMQLLALTDTDEHVAKTQGEISVEEGEQAYDSKTFLMDGKKNWNAAADRISGKALIEVSLAHAAAKISVFVSYTEDFLGTSENPIRKVQDVQKKLVRYVHRVKAVKEGGEVVLPELQGNADATGFSKADRSSIDKEGTARKDTLYAYSYPNDWSDDIEERETYLLLNIPYTKGDGSGELTNNYYKIPVRVSGGTESLCLNRNTEYRVNVTIDREGNPEIVKPVEINATFSVHQWEVQEVEVADDAPQYLVLERDTVEMHNIADTEISFFSSSPITVTVDDAYFIDKDGNEDRTEQRMKDGVEEYQFTITDSIQATDASGGALTGKIKIQSPVPQNVTLRYIDLTVTNEDGKEKKLHIIQYPPEYIRGVPGVFATRDDLPKATYGNFINKFLFDELAVKTDLNKNQTDLRPGGFNPELGFAVKGYDDTITPEEGPIRRFERKKDSATGKFFMRFATNVNVADTAQQNNRMYVVQVTNVNSGHILGRPDMVGSGEDLAADSLNPDNNRMVSPMFMLASQLGTTSTYTLEKPQNDDEMLYSWTAALDHCQQYVEVIKYDDGTWIELKDWRLPSFAELEIIKEKQNVAKEVMERVVREHGEVTDNPFDAYYWTLQSGKVYPTPVGKKRRMVYVRCIRDVTPADLEEFRRHGIR